MNDDTSNGHKSVIAYVILCHDRPEQVLRLARTITALSPRAHVLIRHNQPSGFIDAAQAEAAGAELLTSRIQTRWGDWSLVAAALEAVRCLRDRHDPEWTVLISGQDYPIRLLFAWEEELRYGQFHAVMTGEALVAGRSGWRARDDRERLALRYTHRWYRLPRLELVSRLPSSLRRVVRSGYYRLLHPIQAVVVLNMMPRDAGWALGIRRRTVPWTRAAPAFKGSQWMALSRRAAAICLDGPDAERAQGYFMTTLVPDEAYFQTILENRPEIRVRRERVSWLRWSDGDAPHPVVIDAVELAQAVRAGTPFARKFDESVTPGLLDRIDRTLLFARRADTPSEDSSH